MTMSRLAFNARRGSRILKSLTFAYDRDKRMGLTADGRPALMYGAK